MGLFKWTIINLGGDLVSTWVAKLEVHAEDVTLPRKKCYNLIVAKKSRNLAAVNDDFFAEDVVAKAA